MTNALKNAIAATREMTPYEKFRDALGKIRGELATLVGEKNVDRFTRVALNAVQTTPELLDADRRSLLLACMRAAQDGLLPDGREAVFNIYNTNVAKRGEPDRWIKKVQYLPMVGGLVKKLYDSGHVKFVDAVAVYEKDDFEYRRGDDPRIEHKPYGGREEPGDIIAAYVVVRLTNGEVKREVMWRRDIDKVKAASKAKSGPWVDWFDQQAIKSVIKRAYKQLPSTIEMEQLIESDNAASGFGSIEDMLALPETAGGEPVPAGAGRGPEKEAVRREGDSMGRAGSASPLTAREAVAAEKEGVRRIMLVGGRLIGDSALQEPQLAVGVVIHLEGVDYRVIEYNAKEIVVEPKESDLV